MDNRTPYKTAAELGIEQWEHDGLVAIVGPLSRGELNFDMNRVSYENECGTVHCIGGWVAALADADPGYTTHALFHRDGTGIQALYWPGEVEVYEAFHASETQAARAIVNFLVTGDPQWDAVMVGATP